MSRAHVGDGIRFDSVRKEFDAGSGRETVVALDQFDLAIPAGETHCLIGTSGCGKTTAIRLVNRLETPTAGRVFVGDADVAALDVITLRRSIGYVVQSGGLLPHRTVAENVGVMRDLEGCAADETRRRVAELLELVGLDVVEYGARYPADLSGGQLQRVGVARALALDPDYLLMDEPFGALDPITRRQVRSDLGAITREMKKTTILVTHDLEEAFELGDRVSLMDAGRIVQTGTPAEFEHAPASEFVREFVRSHVGAGAAR